jgi:hypothetical protein
MTPDPIKKQLSDAKKQFKQLDDNVEFWKMMKDFKNKSE